MNSPDPRVWQGRRVLVTGGTGFLGWHLVTQLRALGARVRVLALPPRPDHPLRHCPDVELFEGDVSAPEAVAQAALARETIFHVAGVVAVWGPGLARMDAVHRQGTAAVLAAAATQGARVVHTSSIVAVGASSAGTVFEETSPFPLAELAVDYVRTKRAAEEMALDAARTGQDVVVVNPGYLVGPDDPEGSVMGRLCQRFWKGRVPLAPPGGFNLVDVRDVATGHLLAAERGQSGRRYILGGENLSLHAFLERLALVADYRPRALPRLPGGLLRGLAELAEWRAVFTRKEPYPSRQGSRINRLDWYVRSDRAERELGYRPRPLDDSLRETHDWYRDRGLIGLRGVNRWWMRPAA